MFRMYSVELSFYIEGYILNHFFLLSSQPFIWISFNMVVTGGVGCKVTYPEDHGGISNLKI
jgi:hypothetical protein